VRVCAAIKTVPTARDAVELDYKVIVISDALCGQAHGLVAAPEISAGSGARVPVDRTGIPAAFSSTDPRPLGGSHVGEAPDAGRSD
jgi:hypothetical protein